MKNMPIYTLTLKTELEFRLIKQLYSQIPNILSKKKAFNIIFKIIIFRSFGSFESERKKRKTENSSIKDDQIKIIKIKEYSPHQIRSILIYIKLYIKLLF